MVPNYLSGSRRPHRHKDFNLDFHTRCQDKAFTDWPVDRLNSGKRRSYLSIRWRPNRAGLADFSAALSASLNRFFAAACGNDHEIACPRNYRPRIPVIRRFFREIAGQNRLAFTGTAGCLQRRGAGDGFHRSACRNRSGAASDPAGSTGLTSGQFSNVQTRRSIRDPGALWSSTGQAFFDRQPAEIRLKHGVMPIAQNWDSCGRECLRIRPCCRHGVHCPGAMRPGLAGQVG